MPTQKLSAFAAETEFDYDDLLYLVRGGNSRKIVASDFRKAMFDPRNSIMLFEDWLMALTVVSGQRRFAPDMSSFSVGGLHTTTGALGVSQLQSLSGPAYAHVMLFDSFVTNNVRSCFVPGTLPIICEWRVRFSAAPSATDPIYYCRVGMRSIPSYSTDTSSCHGVWAEIYHNGSAQVWKLVAETAGSKTPTDASVGITINTWHRVAVAYTTSNAYLFLDGTQIASLNSGLPSAGAAPFLAARKTSGIAINIDLDYVWVFKPLTNGR